ncbi:MAG: hypothetical protein ACM3W4_03630 [Ignavibacteriales bacterium]
MVNPQISTRATLSTGRAPREAAGVAGERRWPMSATVSFIVVASAGLWAGIGLVIWLLLH